MTGYDNKAFAKMLRENAIIENGMVCVSTEVWEIIVDRIEHSIQAEQDKSCEEVNENERS